MKVARRGKIISRRFLFWLFFTIITGVMLIVATGANAELSSVGKSVGNITYQKNFTFGFEE
jgi:membrane-associated PAP2 superfamily phosphatase